jgi:hypothetical protein
MDGAYVRYKVRIQGHQPALIQSASSAVFSAGTPPAISVGIGIPPLIEGEIVGVSYEWSRASSWRIRPNGMGGCVQLDVLDRVSHIYSHTHFVVL